MAIQTLKKLSIVFILIVIVLGAAQSPPFPFYTDLSHKNVTVWVVVQSVKEKTYIKVTLPSSELKEKYTWCGYYKGKDIYIRK